MDEEITERVVEKELNQLEEMVADRSAEVLSRGGSPPSVRLRLESQVDGEVYFLKGTFDEYPQDPPLWEFYHPQSNDAGKPEHYPKDEARGGLSTLFLEDPVICHPASRKAYEGYTGKHSGWGKANWQEIEGDSVETIPTFVDMILARINSPLYAGRMAS